MASVTRVVLAPQRFDRTVTALANGLRTLFALWPGIGPDVIALTEMGKDSRWGAVARWAPWWDWHQVNAGGGRDDCGIGFRKRHWVVERVDPHLLSALPMSDRGRNRIWALVVTARHRVTGKRIVWVVVHFPAHVDRRGGLHGRQADVACWLDALARLAAMCRLWGRHYDGVIVAADWNVDTKQDWAVELLREQLQMALAFPHEGTHGHRAIDGFAYRGRIALLRVPTVVRSWLLRRGSDHWPVAALFRL